MIEVQSVLAAVVSFNDPDALDAGIPALLDQVGHVLIVDNGSEAPTVAALRRWQGHPRVTVERLPTNQGIAEALNRAVSFMRRQPFEWLLTMDQDSVVHPQMLNAYSQYHSQHPEVRCLIPTIEAVGHRGAVSGPVEYAITSGTLVHRVVFDRIGLFWTELFIDGVDFDFSLRVRAAKLEIHLVADATMKHRLGDSQCRRRGLGRAHTSHSPLRRYYIMRNTLFVARRHFRQFPRFISRMLLIQIASVAAIVWFGPQRLQSICKMVLAVFDYSRKRLGSYDSARNPS